MSDSPHPPAEPNRSLFEGSLMRFYYECSADCLFAPLAIDMKEDEEFEVDFWEGVIESDPEYMDALSILGMLYTRRGEYERGLETDLRLARLAPLSPIIHYNLACSYSLLSRVSDALDALRQAIELGFSDFDHLEQDEDLEAVRMDPRYLDLISPLTGRTPT